MVPAFKWFRVVAFFSLLVMTTAMAASPVRDSVMPLVAKTYARWSGNMTPAAVPLATTDFAPARAPQVAMRSLTPLPEPDRFSVTTTPSTTSSITQADRFDYAPAGAASIASNEDQLTPDELAKLARQSGSRFDLGPWQPNGGGGSRGGSASLARGNRDAKDNGKQGGTRDASGDRSAAGSGGGARDGGARTPGNGGPRQPAPVPPGTPSGVFTEHTSGLPILTGGAAGGAGGVMTLSSASVAASPEPSTLLLLGTGLAAAARAMRRRFARR